MAEDLWQVARGGAIKARRVGPLGRTLRLVRRHRMRVALSAIVAIVLGWGISMALHGAADRRRRTEIEYVLLCIRADGEIAREMGLDPADDPSSADALLAAAIRADPSRPDAYFMRAFRPARTTDQRLGDLDAAVARGLSERSWHAGRALVLRSAGHHEQALAEERALLATARHDAATLLVEGQLALMSGDRSGAMEKMTEAARLADASIAVRSRALFLRSGLLDDAGDMEGALADLHAVKGLVGDTPVISLRIASLWRGLERRAKAEHLFEDLLIRLAESPVAIWLELTRECRARKEGDWTERLARAGLEKHSTSAELFVKLGLAIDSPERAMEALAAYDRAIAIEPHNPRAHTGRGLVLHRLLRVEEALAAHDRAVEADPLFASAHFGRALALVSLHRPADALLAYEDAIRLDPGNALYHYGRANVLLALGRHEDALAAYTRAADLGVAERSGAHVGRGLALQAAGRAKEALEAYDHAIQINQSDAGAHYNRGCLLFQLGRADDALAAWERAIQHAPVKGIIDVPGFTGGPQDAARLSAQAHCNRGVVLNQLGRPAEALAEQDRAIELYPELAEGHMNRGCNLDALDRLAESLAAHDKAIELDPSFALAHYNRGMTLRRLGRHADARDAWVRAVQLGLRHAVALNRIAWFLATHEDPAVRDPERAVGAARAAVELAPRDGAIWNTLGIALCTAHAWEEAVHALEMSTQLGSGADSWDWFGLAMALWSLGRRDEALKAYERAAAALDDAKPGVEDLRRFRREVDVHIGKQ
jgi:superkiller protein 3